jgi:F-type H+-transporting ATPase subunit delta
MISVAASRYGNALGAVVFAPGSGLEPRDVVDHLRKFEDLLRDSSDLRHVMFSPAVPSSKKRGVVTRLSGDLGLTQKVRNFLYVVIDHHRMDQLSGIREAFEASIDRNLGVVRADVTSALDLDQGQRSALEAQLSKTVGQRVRMEFSVNKSLIGGVVARVGSVVYDGSVRGQLDAIRRRLATEA